MLSFRTLFIPSISVEVQMVIGDRDVAACYQAMHTKKMRVTKPERRLMVNVCMTTTDGLLSFFFTKRMKDDGRLGHLVTGM